MKRVEIDVNARLATVQPGVLNGELSSIVDQHGLFYPPDPASADISSIGGNVATNAGGLCCIKYGITGNYVLGLEIVLGTGEVIRIGRKTIKGVAGLDLVSPSSGPAARSESSPKSRSGSYPNVPMRPRP